MNDNMSTRRGWMDVGVVAVGGLVIALSMSFLEAQTTIEGHIYISPSGEPEGDLVMQGADLEVQLVGGDTEFQTQLDTLRQTYGPQMEVQLQKVYRSQREYSLAAMTGDTDEETTQQLASEARTKYAQTQETYERQVQALIQLHAVAATTSDSEGKFQFQDVAQGRYFIYSHFEITGMAMHYYWLVLVEAGDEPLIEVSLGKSNSVELY